MCSFDPFSGLSRYPIKYSGQCFKKVGQIFLKSAVLAGIHVTSLYNFHPAHEKKNSLLEEKQLMSFAYECVYGFFNLILTYYWHW